MEKRDDIVKVDPLALDKECVELPHLVLQAVDLVARARGEYEQAKLKLEVLQADLREAIQNNPEEYGLTKVTEGTLNAKVSQQPEYQEARKKVIQKKYKLDLAISLQEALEVKKKTLELLVHLYLSGYFSHPQLGQDQREAMEKLTQTMARKKAQYDRGTDKSD